MVEKEKKESEINESPKNPTLIKKNISEKKRVPEVKFSFIITYFFFLI